MRIVKTYMYNETNIISNSRDQYKLSFPQQNSQENHLDNFQIVTI